MDNIILASQSPRRQQLMEQAGFSFRIITPDVDETNPLGMKIEEVPEFLANKKAMAIAKDNLENIIIAADTLVLLNDEILGKPNDAAEAIAMLQRLSGNMHRVVTGVCIFKNNKAESFSTTTEVYFRKLTDAKIQHYVAKHNPLDKAGAYAIQEWIGLVGIEKINGDYYNVMGLPISELVKRLS